jgi:hypothetical protein
MVRPTAALRSNVSAAQVGSPAARCIAWCGIVKSVNAREIKVPMLVAAALCLLAALVGGALIFSDSGHALGFALLGFFGAGAFVLGRKALGFD